MSSDALANELTRLVQLEWEKNKGAETFGVSEDVWRAALAFADVESLAKSRLALYIGVSCDTFNARFAMPKGDPRRTRALTAGERAGHMPKRAAMMERAQNGPGVFPPHPPPRQKATTNPRRESSEREETSSPSSLGKRKLAAASAASSRSAVPAPSSAFAAAAAGPAAAGPAATRPTAAGPAAVEAPAAPEAARIVMTLPFGVGTVNTSFASAAASGNEAATEVVRRQMRDDRVRAVDMLRLNLLRGWGEERGGSSLVDTDTAAPSEEVVIKP
jgi:hypothetical protein